MKEILIELKWHILFLSFAIGLNLFPEFILGLGAVTSLLIFEFSFVYLVAVIYYLLKRKLWMKNCGKI